MTVLIQLTTAQTDTGPFDLYSNLDYNTPFVTNISKAVLQAGYSTALVPDTATVIRVKSVGNCVNYVDIVLINTTTTSTTVATIPCNATATSGGQGITNIAFSLNPTGGTIIFSVGGRALPDKFEIIHNSFKKSTSGIATVNSGPFDDIYGTPPFNTLPTDAQAITVDQFIGTDKDPDPPTRESVFLSETGIPGITVVLPYQQLIWWTYTASDYNTNNIGFLRVTGPTGNTAWDVIRKCPAGTTTSTSTSTTTPPTTTTTTTNPVFVGAKFLVFTYVFNAASGTDLDSTTSIIVPTITQTPNPIGYCANFAQLPSGSNGGPCLFWGGDNTNTGTESVYVDIDAVKAQVPAATDIKIRCKSSWLGVKGDGQVYVEVKAYSAGPITVSPPYNFTGPIGNQIGTTITFPAVTVGTSGCTITTCIGEFNYKLSTGVITRVLPC